MDFLKESQKDIEVARTLVKNRLAVDINDAMKQIQKKKEVEQGLQDKTRTDGADAMEIREVTSIGTTPSITASSFSTSPGNANKLNEIEAFLKKFDRFFSNFYNDTQARLADIAKEVNEIKDQVKGLKLYARPAGESQSTIEIKDEKAEKKQPGHPRSGNFTSGDVAIESIFSNAHGRLQQKR